MNAEHTSETATAHDGGELDPATAAALLEQTTRKAQREFDIRPPLLTLAGAITVLITYGALWLSVRDQQPYSGPSGTALAVLYGTLTVWIVLVAVVLRRATSGVAGRSSRERHAAGIAFATVWICVYVFQGALHHAGAGNAIVYGLYPAAAPILVVGGAAAAYEAARQNWRFMGFALAGVVIAAAAAFAGPAGVWGVVGIGLCVLCLAFAAAQVWLPRT
jgi:hypothetical protein